MKIVLFTLFFLVLILPSGAFAAVMPAAQAAPASTTAAIDKDAKRNARLERLIDRFQKKMEKRLEKKKANSPAPSLMDDSRFRLGLIFVIGALALAILGALIGTGFLGFLSGLAGLAGVILIVWALIEYYG